MLKISQGLNESLTALETEGNVKVVREPRADVSINHAQVITQPKPEDVIKTSLSKRVPVLYFL